MLATFCGWRRSFLRLLSGGALLLAALLLASLPVRAAAFEWNWATSTCEGSTDGCLTNGTRRFPGIGSGSNMRDILFTRVSAVGSATPDTPRSGFGSNSTGPQDHLGGEVRGDMTAGAVSQVRYRLTFVAPGTSTPLALPVPVYMTSLDTDGYNYHATGGFRERIEFHGTPAALLPGSQLEPSTSLGGGQAFRPVVCTNGTEAGCTAFGAGGYAFYPGFNNTMAVQVSAIYPAGQTSLEFSFGIEVSAAGPGNFIESRQFGIQVGIPDPDVQPVFSNLPTVIRPGQIYTGLTLTCSNPGATASALATGCAPTVSTGSISALSCSPAVPATVAPDGAITCTFSYTAPGTQGGTDEAATQVVFTGTTGSVSDINKTNDVTTASAPLIDALDESLTTPVGSAASLQVLSNDARGSGAATLANVSLAAVSPPTAGSSFDPSTGLFSVPAGAAPGVYSVTYQVCAHPAVVPAVCDTAVATITVAAADLSPVFTGLPTVLGPGQTYTGLTLTCTNAASATTAQAPVCLPSASAGSVGNIVCSPAGATTLAAGAAIRCTFDYTAPFTQGGSDDVATPVTFTGTTGATNDGNASNNTTTADAVMIDAVDDAVARTPGQPGQTSPVGGNDQWPTGSSFSRIGGSCTNASVSADGTATFDVPASGSCTVLYRVCAPAPNATSCDTATLTVTPSTTSADLSVAIIGVPPTAAPGTVVTGTLTCTNAGPDAALQATCAGGAGTSTSNCRVGGVAVTLPLASLAAGQAIVCDISATTPSSGRLTVPATTGASNDTNTSNNSTSVEVVVLVGPDLRLAKSHEPALFIGGQTGRYLLVVRNEGDAPTSAAYSVEDPLPAGMTVAALPGGSGWDCSATVVGSSRLSCSRAEVLAVGQSAPAITLVVNVAAAACASPDANGQCTTVNTATVSGGGEHASRQSDNQGSDATPVRLAGSVSGRVWIDADHDRRQGSSERGASGVTVEVINAAGTLVGSALTDAQGDYIVRDIPVGSYTIRFRDASSGAYYGRPVSNDPAGGNDPTADSATGVVAAGVLQGVSVPLGATRINQSLPLDPSGVVYDSASRAALGGATVALLDAGGALVPSSCVVGGINRLTTVASGALAGAYSFLLLNPAPEGCPGAGSYQLQVTPPAGYLASTSIPAQAGVLVPPAGCVGGVGAGVCAVQSQALPPSGSESTAYYLSIRLDPASGPDVINNHIPLDPSSSGTLLVVKTGDRTQAEIGDSVRYSIAVRRTDSGGATLPAVEIIDTLPAGFRYIAGTAMVGGVKIADPSGAPGPVLRFRIGALAAGASSTLSYRVRIGVGAQQGTGINRAQATGTPGAVCGSSADALCSNISQFRVTVTGGVFGAEACVVGRVFVDCNHDHVQGPEEPGIPGVRFYLNDGTSLISDVEGKYSVCGLAPRTTVMVVDGSTLPRGSRLTTSSNRNAGDAFSLFLDLKNGELHRADFIEGSCSNTVLEQVKARRARGETQTLETEKKGGRVLKFDGKPVTAPAQATDSARQRGRAAGQGESGAVKPRQAVGTAGAAGARTETRETLREPVSVNPASSGATVPSAEEDVR